jgi:hypothetical protein
MPAVLSNTVDAWPELPQSAWGDTCVTLQLWTQIVGKIRLALTPAQNHTWSVALYPTARGLTTSPMWHGTRVVQIDFDFIDHMLIVLTSDGDRRHIALGPMSVATFYGRVMEALESIGTPVRIWPTPVEMAQPVPFHQDHAPRPYDAEYVTRFWRVLLQTTRVFNIFPLFYSYAYPSPEGFAAYSIEPAEARFDAALGEFVFPYEAMRQSEDPDAALLQFLQSTYEAAANCAHWDRQALESTPA